MPLDPILHAHSLFPWVARSSQPPFPSHLPDGPCYNKHFSGWLAVKRAPEAVHTSALLPSKATLPTPAPTATVELFGYVVAFEHDEEAPELPVEVLERELELVAVCVAVVEAVVVVYALARPKVMFVDPCRVFPFESDSACTAVVRRVGGLAAIGLGGTAETQNYLVVIADCGNVSQST
ncbi:hypothetical protein UA08_03211 [Talaromyces atroroseus]|uniref:Uncharacterized protein n=1 Tax=Talaromyces atroroseus TaxID=1441469 RepID=A0A225AIN7_TALAT|nr:hypothetical protein UA08_03211 [Talaromyces atroroseus]OKL61301.1 hypothetical protein UA08_03211 [Talaromyces atroroseus]